MCDDQKSEHGRFFADDRKPMVRPCGVWGSFQAWRYGCLLCTVVQPGQWYPALLKKYEREEIVHEEREQSVQKRENRGSPMFEVQSIPLQAFGLRRRTTGTLV